MGRDREAIYRENRWITAGALLYEIEGQSCCAGETAVTVLEDVPCSETMVEVYFLALGFHSFACRLHFWRFYSSVS